MPVDDDVAQVVRLRQGVRAWNAWREMASRAGRDVAIDLIGANLPGAVLAGANLNGANLNGRTWPVRIWPARACSSPTSVRPP